MVLTTAGKTKEVWKMDAFMTLLGSYCFPIVMCIALFWYIVKIQKNNNTLIEELTTYVKANTKVLDDLCDRVTNLEEEVRKNDDKV